MASGVILASAAETLVPNAVTSVLAAFNAIWSVCCFIVVSAEPTRVPSALKSVLATFSAILLFSWVILLECSVFVVYLPAASVIAACFALLALVVASVATSSGAGVQSVALFPFSNFMLSNHTVVILSNQKRNKL